MIINRMYCDGWIGKHNVCTQTHTHAHKHTQARTHTHTHTLFSKQLGINLHQLEANTRKRKIVYAT